MMLFIDICELTWLPVFLSWMLPFLLGVLLGWLIWGSFKTRFLDQEKELLKYKERVYELDTDLQASQKARTQLEGESAILRGRVRELESAARSAWDPAIGKEKLRSPQVPAAATAKGRSGSTPESAMPFDAIPENNLQVIEGIGPKMEEILQSHGLRTWASLAETSLEQLREILDNADPKYRIIDPSSWPDQASLAASSSWTELLEFQKSISASGTTSNSSKLEKWMIDAGLLRRFRQNDLKAIEGIGPKIASLLSGAGIDTWDALAATPVEQIQEILDGAGERFKLADPLTWPAQAALAANGEWEELKALQDRLLGGREK